MRLNRFLAAAGVGSRRHCDELIAASRVTINGKVCTNFSAQPSADDHVKVDGAARTLMIAAIRYLDAFVKHDGTWFFTQRKLMVDWTETRTLATS